MSFIPVVGPIWVKVTEDKNVLFCPGSSRYRSDYANKVGKQQDSILQQPARISRNMFSQDIIVIWVSRWWPNIWGGLHHQNISYSLQPSPPPSTSIFTLITSLNLSFEYNLHSKFYSISLYVSSNYTLLVCESVFWPGSSLTSQHPTPVPVERQIATREDIHTLSSSIYYTARVNYMTSYGGIYIIVALSTDWTFLTIWLGEGLKKYFYRILHEYWNA